MLALAALAVQVAPADPTAMFKGDGEALKFDPTCRDYSLDTVKDNPSCAARVANGEPGPSIAIAVRTLSATPAKTEEAIILLRKSAAITNSPAVHYFLGTVLGTAERVRPNYPEAVRHLTIAAERGNAAAMDMLGSMVLIGQGTSRDVPRAIRLYETAAANGFPNAALKLGKLYLAGRFVSKDEARGRAWLDAAAAVNFPGAAQLASMAAADAKVKNFQLIPSPNSDDVKIVQYSTFDNPDIPPSFGFDFAFQSIHDASYSDLAVRKRLELEATAMPTPYLYELASRLASLDPERAMRTYLLARVRMSYDANRCTDAAALEALRAWDMLVGPNLRFLFVSGRPSKSTVEAVLNEEAKLSGDTQPWWVCRSGIIAMSEAMSGKAGPLKLKPMSDWPAIREVARKQLLALAVQP